MAKKGKDKSKEKREGREAKRPSSGKGILIGVGIVLLVGIGFAYYNYKGNPPPSPAAPVDSGELPGLQINEGPWSAEEFNLRKRLDRIGLPALLEEGSAMHMHQHLDLFIHGKSAAVPAMVGVNLNERFISPVHTHDTTGEIHIESPSVQMYNLGQFFDIWGVRLTSKCIGSYCEDPQNSLKAFVNGAAVAGDPRNIQLRDHDEIVIAFGTEAELPKPIPSTHQFTTGS